KNSRIWSIWYPCAEAFGGCPRNSLISARLFIFAQIFLGELLVRLLRHASLPPQVKTERADSANDRKNRAKKEPDRYCHVFGRFSVLRAVAKRACQRLLRGEQDR